MIEKPQPSEVEQRLTHYKSFAEVSNAQLSDIQGMRDFFRDLPELPDDAFEAAKTIRHYLIEKGFEYDDDVFTLQDIARGKRGNCLGLSLIIAAVLSERGYNPKFEIITNPKDAIYREDLRQFEEFTRGDHFDYDNPVLPRLSERAQHPTYRFAPLEHPVLILDGKNFETTSLEEVEEDPGWSPDAELKTPVSFDEVASNVYVDKAKMAIRKGEYDIEQLKEWCNKATEMWGENREAYVLLWKIAREQGNKGLEQHVINEYKRIGGDDSRYLYNLYEMTGDKTKLDAALDRFPAYIEAFAEKHIDLENDNREARFNLAVAAWCIANSNAYDLEKFYKARKNQLERLFGREILDEVLNQ